MKIEKLYNGNTKKAIELINDEIKFWNNKYAKADANEKQYCLGHIRRYMEWIKEIQNRASCTIQITLENGEKLIID